MMVTQEIQKEPTDRLTSQYQGITPITYPQREVGEKFGQDPPPSLQAPNVPVTKVVAPDKNGPKAPLLRQKRSF